jgi:hypothetical protein
MLRQPKHFSGGVKFPDAWLPLREPAEGLKRFGRDDGRSKPSGALDESAVRVQPVCRDNHAGEHQT